MDLDGTLIRIDLTVDLLVLCARNRPLIALSAICVALVSPSRAKRILVEGVGDLIEPSKLSYDPVALDLIAVYQSAGRSVELVSGSDELLVTRISDWLGKFSFAAGSTPGRNLTAGRKARFLTERHPKGFAYAGDSCKDMAVWRQSAKGYGFGAPAAAYRLRKQRDDRPTVQMQVPRASQLRALFESARPRHWVKAGLLLLVPVLHAGQLAPYDAAHLAFGLLSFILVAVGGYFANDIIDATDDRLDAVKRHRPLASGALRTSSALMASLACFSAGLTLAALLPVSFFAHIAAYVAVSISYSLWIKRWAGVDVVTLAALYMLRVNAGAELVGLEASQALLVFVGSAFLSMSLIKRYAETAASGSKVAGRPYTRRHLPLIALLGIAAAVIAILSVVLFGLRNITDALPATRVIAATLLGLWFAHIWRCALRGDIGSDPVRFVLSDIVSWVNASLLIAWIAIDLAGLI